MDMLEAGNIKISEVDHEQQIEICFNILPGGKSFLHMLAEANLGSQNDQILSYHTTKGLFEIASKEIKLWHQGVPDGCAFEIPILPDIYGQTALDHSLGLYHTYDKIFFKEKRSMEDLRNVENYAMAEVIFAGLKDYGFMHSSFFIVEAVTKATQKGLPAILDYLDHRMKTIDHGFDSKTEHAILHDQVQNSPSMGDYGRMFTNIWISESVIRDTLFNPRKSLQPMEMEYLDMPFVYKPNKAGFEFIYALNKCDELEIFNLKSVQIIIDSHAEYWNRLNYIFVGIPMAFNLLNFWYWSNIVLVNLEQDPDAFES